MTEIWLNKLGTENPSRVEAAIRASVLGVSRVTFPEPGLVRVEYSLPGSPPLFTAQDALSREGFIDE